MTPRLPSLWGWGKGRARREIKVTCAKASGWKEHDKIKKLRDPQRIAALPYSLQ